MKIEGTVAVVTGAAKGIGRAFCFALLENEAAVVEMLDICSIEGQELQKELESRFGAGKARFTHCDVSCKESLTKGIHGAVAAHGQLNILCNNAGVIDENNWEKMLEIDLVSVIRGTKIALEVMADGGSIVNTASMSGLQAPSIVPVYVAAKHGVVGYTRSIAPVAFERKGVRVNCICPSTVLTSLIEATIDQYRASVEKYGILSPDAVAHGLVQLIEDDSNNGAVMKITQKQGIEYMKYPKAFESDKLVYPRSKKTRQADH